MMKLLIIYLEGGGARTSRKVGLGFGVCNSLVHGFSGARAFVLVFFFIQQMCERNAKL
jgi:hypothetical protein